VRCFESMIHLVDGQEDDSWRTGAACFLLVMVGQGD